LQREGVEKFDSNENGIVEWSEFFPELRSATSRAAQRIARGGIQQVPEATKLAK
jgi:hypothetical protein